MNAKVAISDAKTYIQRYLHLPVLYTSTINKDGAFMNSYIDDPPPGQVPPAKLIDVRDVLFWLRLIVCFFLSYPFSGFTYAMTMVLLSIYHEGHYQAGSVLMIILWTILVPLFGGFVPANEGDVGPRINMYPWILCTTIVLFFLMSLVCKTLHNRFRL